MRLVTVKPGKVKLIRTRPSVLTDSVVGLLAGKRLPSTIIVGSQVSVIGLAWQLFPMAVRVNV